MSDFEDFDPPGTIAALEAECVREDMSAPPRLSALWAEIEDSKPWDKIEALDEFAEELERELDAKEKECAELRLLLRQIFADLDAHDVLPEWLPIIDAATKGD